jgi:hypothetical protein
MERIVGIGLVNKDCVAQVPAWERDEKTTATAYLEQTGGPVPVALATLARLGWASKPSLFSVIGGDRDGEEVSTWLTDDGLDTSLLQREGRRSPPANRWSLSIPGTPRGRWSMSPRICRRSVFRTGTGRCFPARVFCTLTGVTCPPRSNQRRSSKTAAGIVSLDLGTMRGGTETLLPLCDIVLASKKGGAGAFPALADSPSGRCGSFYSLARLLPASLWANAAWSSGSERGTARRYRGCLPFRTPCHRLVWRGRHLSRRVFVGVSAGALSHSVRRVRPGRREPSHPPSGKPRRDARAR